MTSKCDLLLLAVTLGMTAATPAIAAPPIDAPVAYVVKPGDTLIGLASAYLTKPSD